MTKIKALFICLALIFVAAPASAQSYISSSSLDFFDGDSIMLGGGATGSPACSMVFGVVVAPKGNCMADLVAIHDNTQELGYAVLGTCLEYTATDPNGLCNLSSTTVGSLINRYKSTATHIVPGMRVYVQIGTNDVFSWSNGNSLVNAQTFHDNLATVLSAYASIVGSGNVIVGEIPYMPTAYAAYVSLINVQIDDVARQYGYGLAENAATYQMCAIAHNFTDMCTPAGDATHPDNAGHAAMAVGWENASFTAAQSATAAARKTMTLNYRLDSSTNVNGGGRSTLFPLSTGVRNTCAGNTSCGNLTTANDSTCYGNASCGSVATGGTNSGFGSGACGSTTGQANTCIGFGSGGSFGVINFSTFIGASAGPKANLDSSELVIGNSMTGLGSNSVAIGISNAPGFYSGTGVPTFSAPNASIYLRYDGTTGSRWYANTSGASTNGTTWTNLAAP